jgi:DNA (cytosine-5)-methyltransferase 1
VSDGTGGPAANRSDRPGYGGTPYSTQLREISQLLPTPVVADSEGGRYNSDGHQDTLPGTARLLPTPGAYDGDRGGARTVDERKDGGHSVNLQDVAVHGLLPTPVAGDAKATRNRTARRTKIPPTGIHSGDTLHDILVPLLPTPVAHPSGNTPEGHLRKKPGREVVTDLAILTENDLIETGGRLLPTPTSALADGGQTSRGGDRAGEPLLAGIADEAAEQIGDGAAWGPYQAAVDRWSQVVGRDAPAPTLADGKNGGARLNAALPEWMMGWPLGWVTDPVLGLSRSEQLRACGNGVVPQQAATALRIMLAREGVPPLREAA